MMFILFVVQQIIALQFVGVMMFYVYVGTGNKKDMKIIGYCLQTDIKSCQFILSIGMMLCYFPSRGTMI